MTVFHNFSHAHLEREQVRHMLMPTAVGVALITFAFNALGTFGDGSPGATHSIGEFLAVSGVTLVAVVVLFALVLPRALRKDTAATALTLSILGALTVAVFWAGVTPALAVGGILLGIVGRDATKGQGMSIAACVLGLLVAAAYISIYALDWMSTNGIG